jgi:protein-L-isoaspartate(D-aspartate) O-methyltransferase
MDVDRRESPREWTLMLAVLALGLALLGLAGLACAAANDTGDASAPDAEVRRAERLRMVEVQIEARGIDDPAVLAAMRAVPRERFVPDSMRPYAYNDGPLRIGYDQTISQPYIVALMTALIRPTPSKRVLEIGTGSGYQAAVLAECAAQVYTIEIVPELGEQAAARLRTLGYENVHTRIGDGFDGWPEAAPFDGIVVTAAPEEVPRPLLEQLAVGGRLVIPLGRGTQDLMLVTRTGQGYRRESITPVRFVPMTGKAQDER